MILEKKKLLFNTIFLVFEDNKIRDVVSSGKYSSIVAISRTDLEDLPISRRIKTTAVIDLSQNTEDIFSKYNDTTRNEIRRTYNIPELSFVLEDQKTLDAYYLYKKFEISQKRVPFPIEDMKDCHLFTAYYKGEMISGMYVDSGEKNLRLRYVFSKRLDVMDKELYKIIGYSTRRIIWEVCQWGKKNGYASLDMASVNMENAEVAGISTFKMSFGGVIVNEYNYIYRSQLFQVFERLAILKNYFKKLFLFLRP